MASNRCMNSRETQAAETRQRMLESAFYLFAKKGYKGTSVREINRSINLADGLLYHYFPGGKKEIFKVVVQDNLLCIIDEIERKNTVDKYINMPLDEVLECTYVNFIETVNNNMDIIRLIFCENEAKEYVTQEQLQQLIGSKEPWFKVLLRRKYELGEIREMDFECAAISVVTVFINYIMSKVIGTMKNGLDNKEQRKRFIEYQVSMWRCN